MRKAIAAAFLLCTSTALADPATQSPPAASQADLDALAARLDALAARVTRLEQQALPACVGAHFCDNFDSLSMENIYTGKPGIWSPVSWHPPNNGGYAVNQGWMVNPFNPATPDLQSL